MVWSVFAQEMDDKNVTVPAGVNTTGGSCRKAKLVLRKDQIPSNHSINLDYVKISTFISVSELSAINH